MHDVVLDMRAARDDLLSAIAEVGSNDWKRYVPYGSRTLHELLAHLAGADQVWGLLAQGLLRGESEQREPLTPAEAAAVRARAVERGRTQPPVALLDEMERRRRLLLSLYELLEPLHLAFALKSFGERHNSVRERIWVGYHDRKHAADIRRALRMRWHPQHLSFVPELLPAVESLSTEPTEYVIHNVDPVAWEEPSSVPGWTYRDLLAHIATGDWVLEMHLRHIIEHGTVREWPDVTAGNAERLEERRLTSVNRLIEEYLSMRHETMLLLSKLKPQHLRLNIELWWLPRPNAHTVLEYVLGFHTHELSHREQLRPAMKYLRKLKAGA